MTEQMSKIVEIHPIGSPSSAFAGDGEEAALLALEAQYCSHGDTVHYTDPPKIFEGCDGSYVFDLQGRPYLDLQMWYSAVNFGYKNQRLSNAVKRQLDTLPQVASQYLHREKIELATMIAKAAAAVTPRGRSATTTVNPAKATATHRKPRQNPVRSVSEASVRNGKAVTVSAPNVGRRENAAIGANVVIAAETATPSLPSPSRRKPLSPLSQWQRSQPPQPSFPPR